MEGMISTRTYGLIEVTLTFGGVLVFCAYQIWSVRRAIARRRARERDAAGGVAQPDGAGEGRRGIR